MSKGGKRIGAGRKAKAEEDKVKVLAISAIVAKYGSEEKGFTALLDTEVPVLLRYVFEHAFGKPKEKVEHSTDPEAPVIFKLDGRYSKDS